MTIAIDCRHFDSSGIGVYLRECLPWLLKSGNDFLLIGKRNRLEHFRSRTVKAEIIDCGVKNFSLRELFFFPKRILKKINSADLFYSPFFNVPRGVTVPVYLTIHDIIFPDIPELTSKAGLAVRMWFYRRAAKKAKKIFTVSEFSKSRIEHYLGTAKPVIVTHSAIQPEFLSYRNKIQNLKKKRTVVFIGNIKKHKGLDYFLDAFCAAKKEGLPHKLIIIGAKENFRTSDNTVTEKINRLGSDAVSFTGFIPDEEVLRYLSEASLLVQPSLYEGFGLPPLEAMVLGTRALISDIPVFREIYAGYPVVFFKAGDPDDLKQKLRELLLNKEAEALALSEDLTLKYTFEKTASIILKNFSKPPEVSADFNPASPKRIMTR